MAFNFRERPNSRRSTGSPATIVYEYVATGEHDDWAVRVYAINRLVEVERPVFLSVALPDGRMAVSPTVVITRYVAPPPG